MCRFDGNRFRVGPQSAGADPGPCSYRKGGPLTITDCNVMCGKIVPELFPSVFGPDQNEPLDAEAVTRKFRDLADEASALAGREMTPQECAQGFLSVAVDQMALAIKKISVQRGYDVTRGYTLLCFGGAGGQHACLVAQSLGIAKVFVHPLSGVLSAYGMGLADVIALKERTVEVPLSDGTFKDCALGPLEQLEREALGAVREQRPDADEAAVSLIRRLMVRYAGTDTAMALGCARGRTAGEVARDFHEAHRGQFGFALEGREVIVDTATVEAVWAGGGFSPAAAAAAAAGGGEGEGRRAEPKETRRCHFAGGEMEAGVYALEDLGMGCEVPGPAIICEKVGTTVVEPGWDARVLPGGIEMIMREGDAGGGPAGAPTSQPANLPADAVDPILLEIFNNTFMSVAEQMGLALRNTAYSVNIKERLDFSCAIFDQHGGLVANAPHMPVHLGSMGESVRIVISRNGDDIRPGDSFMLNDPYNGGTHLPDITVVTPVFAEEGEGEGEIIFYVASRGHHADVGGITPASMPANSTRIEEEGVLINNFRVVSAGQFDERGLRDLLTKCEFPCRSPETNEADLRAQIAANALGIRELRKMVSHFGLRRTQAYMKHVQDNAEECVRRAISKLSSGEYRYEMDDGAVVAVRTSIDVERRRATLDFEGTSPQAGTNFNAPKPVCRAAAMYVFRTLVDDEIPMNEGCMKAIELRIPQGTLLSPSYPAAVVAGNVETSQVVTDCIYGALGVMAASQGTMNNVTFGNQDHQYYETICGGAGAGPGFDGCDAVHTHMTNSRMTDPEVLEQRYPVRLNRFEIRLGSGGR